jgi:hypothetical protein
LSSMAALGVDQVNAGHPVLVKLGMHDANIQDLKSILTGLLDVQTQTAQHVFGERGAELVMDAGSFSALLADASSPNATLVPQLMAIGVDHVDVVPSSGSVSASDLKSYALNADGVQPVEVTVLGTHLNEVSDALTQDLLQHK